MHDAHQIAAHFNAELFDHYQGTLRLPDDNFYIGQQYWAWRPANAPPTLQPSRRMSRARLEKWLHAHFLKICLPAVRDPGQSAAIYAPLNLTAFLRLVIHMHSKGYPAHWLATVLEGLTSGTIKTTARAPRKEDLDAHDVDRAWPARQICIAPFAAEFTTLLSVFRPLIPFGIAGAAPPPTDVHEYSLAFPDFKVSQKVRLRVPHFVLVFYDAGKFGAVLRNLRAVLVDDEAGDGSSRAKDIRAGGVHVVSTFSYVTDSRTASFWMRRDAAEVISSAGWTASIWRTDSWTVQVEGGPVAGSLVKGSPWA